MKRLPTRKVCTCPQRIPAHRPSRLQVRQAMRSAPAVLSPDLTIAMVLHQVKDSEFDAWPVGDTEGLWGMIRSKELEQAADEGALHQKLAEILGDTFPPWAGHGRKGTARSS